ncbi:MAG: hypothetical protein RIQ56_153 [Candidatus Parcubacteria bacterium]|jgi:hypothetical protein
MLTLLRFLGLARDSSLGERAFAAGIALYLLGQFLGVQEYTIWLVGVCAILCFVSGYRGSSDQ